MNHRFRTICTATLGLGLLGSLGFLLVATEDVAAAGMGAAGDDTQTLPATVPAAPPTPVPIQQSSAPVRQLGAKSSIASNTRGDFPKDRDETRGASAEVDLLQVTGFVHPDTVCDQLFGVKGAAAIHVTRNNGTTQRVAVTRTGTFAIDAEEGDNLSLRFAASVPGMGLWSRDGGQWSATAGAVIEIDVGDLQWVTVCGTVDYEGAPAQGQLVLRPMATGAQAAGLQRDVQTTLQDGSWQCPLAGGSYAVGLVRPGHATPTWHPQPLHVVPAEQQLPVAIAFAAAGPLRLLVCDIRSEPIANQPFVLRAAHGGATNRAHGAPVVEGRTDSNGLWVIDALHPGVYDVLHLRWGTPPRPGERLTANSPKARLCVVGVVDALPEAERTVFAGGGWSLLP